MERLKAILQKNREQGEFLKKLLDVSRVGLAVVRYPDLSYELVNSTYLNLPGLRHRDVVGRRITEVLPMPVGETVERIIRETVATGKSVRLKEFGSAGGPAEKPSYWNVEHLTLPEPDGSVKRVLMVASEVTEEVTTRKKMEDLARQAEVNYLQLEAVIDQMQEGLSMISPDFSLIRANRRATELLGVRNVAEKYDHETFISQLEFFDLSGKRLPLNEWPLERLQKDEKFRHLEFRVRSKTTGRVRVLNFNGTTVRDRQGKPFVYLLTFRDNTQEYTATRERERLLREVDRRVAELEAIISSIGHGVIIYDRDGRIVRINQAAFEILDYEAGDIGRPILERLRQLILRDPDGNIISAETSSPFLALQGVERKNVVFEVVSRKGRSAWVSMSSVPVYAPDGSSAGAVVVFADVTRFRNLQKRQEDLLHSVSHDLRTPLTVILARAQLVLRAPASPSNPVHLQSVITAARQMNTMIQDLVDSARIESGALVLHPQSLPLVAFARGVVDRLGGAIDMRRLSLDLPDQLPEIRADPDRLERVLVNLINNAFQYSPSGSPVVLRVRQVDGEKVEISVIDQGPGIPAEEQQKIFERFGRGRPERPKSESLGLGLYISKQIVEAHGGKIGFESIQGKGTRFYVILAVRSSQEKERRAAA